MSANPVAQQGVAGGRHGVDLDSWAYFGGEFVRLRDANVNIATHALNYGTGVFEGIRAYWNAAQKQLYGLKVEEHYRRMERNCRLVKIRLPASPARLTEITVELLRRNAFQQDVYIRPLAFKASLAIGVKLSGLEDAFGIFMAPMGDYIDTQKGLHLTVSSWRRLDDNDIPGRGKLTGSYLNAALAVDDARTAGFDDAVMLTADGHVSEGSAANLFMVREGRLVTTPVTDAILEGITRRALIEMAGDLGIPVEVRPIDRTELYLADELFLCGTGVQIAPVTQVDFRPVGDGRVGPIARRLQQEYIAACRGENDRYRHWIVPVYA